MEGTTEGEGEGWREGTGTAGRVTLQFGWQGQQQQLLVVLCVGQVEWLTTHQDGGTEEEGGMEGRRDGGREGGRRDIFISP